MNAVNGHGGIAGPAAVTRTRPVILLRGLPGIAGQTARVVHLVPLPAGGQTGTVSALCGALLRLEEVEWVSPGRGMPCSPCALTQIAAHPLPPPARGTSRGEYDQR